MTAKLCHSDWITSVLRSMDSGPATLKLLLAEHTSLWHSFGWDAYQVSLWLSCTPVLHKCQLPCGAVAWTLNTKKLPAAITLGDELVALLQKAGRSMPLIQLMSKLPAGMVVTEPMLQAAAQKDARLEIKGPLLKLASTDITLDTKTHGH